MVTLLLRLAGPMQSWGVQSRFGVRDAGLEPSKSGVIGLLCAALGRDRQADIRDLAALRLGVRVDQEGLLQRDYHTAGKGGYLRASGAIQRKTLIVSARYYLADARFLVGLEGADAVLLTQVHDALRDPHWPLYLGRKAFVPSEPVWLADGLRPQEGLARALADYPWLGHGTAPEILRLVLEDPAGSQVRPDQPLSFSERRFAPRHVMARYLPVPVRQKGAPCTSPS